MIQALSPDATPRRVQLRADQLLKVGSSGWADLCVANDRGLLEVHFEVRSSPQGCVVRGLSADAPTLVNGEPISTLTVYDGDEIVAGHTKFRLSIQGGPSRPRPDEPEEVVETPAPVAETVAAVAAPLGLVGVCAYLEFADDIEPMAQKADSADVLIAELTKLEKYQDAIRLRAYLLEKRAAVWWGYQCIREDVRAPLPSPQARALDAVAEWVEDNTETRRRAAEARAAEASYSGPGATLALAAFWSDGSLSPAGAPDVEPDERLTSQGVTAALVMAAYLGDSTQSQERFAKFLQRGKRIADGEIEVPGDD